VVLAGTGAVAGVDVRGAAPGTRETDLLSPFNSVEKVHAIVLSGGSSFGLDSASGVMQYLEEEKIGYETRVARIPIVPAAILFDLGLGGGRIIQDKRAGYLACKAAGTRVCDEGNVGAGAGATVGKLFGLDRAMKGGLGTASIHVGALCVSALVAVNALGDIIDPKSGEILAGARSSDGKRLINTMDQLRQGKYPDPRTSAQNTTIGVIATNAALTKAQAGKIAQMAHDGLARSINPVHTPSDGDTLYCLATGTLSDRPDLTLIGALAAEIVAQSVCRAVLKAKGLPGLPSHQDLMASMRG